MATLSVKPGQRCTVPDWLTSYQLLSAEAERLRSASHQVRQEARTLRNETSNQVGRAAGRLLPGLPEEQAEEYGVVTRSGCMEEGTGGGCTCTEHAESFHFL